MWWLLVCLHIALFVWISIGRSPQLALGIVVPLAFVLPSWIILPLFEIPGESIVASGLDLKVAVGTACLILYCFLPGRTFPIRPVPCDVAVAGLLATHCLADIASDGFRLIVFARAYGEWYVPYMTGRLAFQSRSDVLATMRWLGTLAVGLAGVAVVEAVFRVNLAEAVFGQRPEEGALRRAERWGIKRAYGTCLHPIYFGGLQIYLAGSTWWLSAMALRRHVRVGWLFAPLASLLGVLASASRGPILAFVPMAIGCLFLARPRWRVPFAVIGFLAAGLLVLNIETVVATFEQWSGESQRRKQRTIEVDGVTTEYTGTRNRILTFEVYKIALLRSGLLGFGTEAVTGFPVNVPLGPQDAALFETMYTIENSYVLLTLRFGYLGLLMFLACGATALGQLFWVFERTESRTVRRLSQCLFAALLAAQAVIFTVWMPHELGFPLLWLYGVSSGLFLARASGQLVPRHVERPTPQAARP